MSGGSGLRGGVRSRYQNTLCEILKALIKISFEKGSRAFLDASQYCKELRSLSGQEPASVPPEDFRKYCIGSQTNVTICIVEYCSAAK